MYYFPFHSFDVYLENVNMVVLKHFHDGVQGFALVSSGGAKISAIIQVGQTNVVKLYVRREILS